ncbi:MAG: hypothetical protein ACD_79C00109G0002 [uncultured bacterium]|nr:MAG: hypothetical protein ACD_79C00109G0002 [uncultured bacterium]
MKKNIAVLYILLISSCLFSNIISAKDENNEEYILYKLSEYFGEYSSIEKENSSEILGIGEYVLSGEKNITISYNQLHFILEDFRFNKGWTKRINFLESIWIFQEFDGKVLKYNTASKWFGVYKYYLKFSIDFTEYPIIEINHNGKKNKYKFLYKEKPIHSGQPSKPNSSEKKEVKPYSNNPITIG